ncbi:hypothetical protein FCM35_KLT01665 [Carex littledalei]|uniref:Uncharacterized protein n=1 Tax=Carex littledalei TaxID=544730 RepID=A0A833VUF8_9POAL|nr:hypothetical protein FCM35_KLT01665 [Carex littledalei]
MDQNSDMSYKTKAGQDVGALLQERFRELERMKEMREGRCLGPLGMNNATLWPSNSVLVLSTSEKPSWFFHPDLLYPSRPLFETKFLCLMDGLQPASLASEETDIDTSLHL